MILVAVTAQGAYREGARRVEDGHDSYEIIQYRNSNGVRPEGLLWFGPSVPMATVPHVTTYTNQLDEPYEVVTVTNQVPVPHSLCKWVDGDSQPTKRTEQEVAAYDAYVAAQQQAQQYAQLQAIVDSPAATVIRTIEEDIDWLIEQGCPIERPLEPAIAIATIRLWALSQTTEIKADATARSAAMLGGLSGLEDAGITAATINAVWLYMKATGQD